MQIVDGLAIDGARLYRLASDDAAGPLTVTRVWTSGKYALITPWHLGSAG
jgi:hypothetical protein